MAEIYQLPESGGSASGVGNIPFSIPIGGFGGNGGMFGNGCNTIGDLIGLAIVASIFGWNNGGGFGGGGNNSQLGFLSSQLNSDTGRELIMQAVTSQGEASRSAIQGIANTLGQDFNLVNSAVQNVQNALCTLSANQGMSTLQIINAIQSGNANMYQQLCQCCCEQKLLTTEQGYQEQIRTIEQTNQLGSQADRNTASIVGAIASLQTNITKEFCDVKEREMQEKINTQGDIITQLRGQIDNANQTNQIIGYVNSVITPLQREVDKIRENQPNTVPVIYPNITAVNNTPYGGGFYGGWNGFNGWGGNVVF